MTHSAFLRRAFAIALFITAVVSATGNRVYGQAQGQATAPQTAKAAAPIDLTGYWVSIVTEDWRWRMVTPPKGDYASVPINAEAKKVADAWDPARDQASGEQCKSYGAAAIMRVPGRVHITWQDDNTLKVETDAGTQTRLLHFGNWKAPGGEATWQGDSVASWDVRVVPAGTPPDPTPPKFGSLKVVTTHMRPGYLRKNGVPYSADAVMTEYFELYKERSGVQWMVVTTLVDDPKYLQQQYVTSPNFKKEADGSKWDPTSCSTTW